MSIYRKLERNAPTMDQIIAIKRRRKQTLSKDELQHLADKKEAKAALRKSGKPLALGKPHESRSGPVVLIDPKDYAARNTTGAMSGETRNPLTK